jgi:PAS domain S-box-containing protein
MATSLLREQTRMPIARSTIVPTGRECTFGDDEIIVSKTDIAGRITYANHIFMQVSGYAEHELLGAPHSLVRHPGMPRSVFRFLWERLLAGHEVFAYVNNLARSGDNYWVLAHMTPSFLPDGTMIGFHSNRRVPERSRIAKAQRLYDLLLAEEQRHADRATGLESGYAMLTSTLLATGKSYDEWVWTL